VYTEFFLRFIGYCNNCIFCSFIYLFINFW